MPEGVEAYVDGGFATLEFSDLSQRGPALAKLAQIGGPESIETDTRSGARFRYRVPEGNAREAGLLDSPKITGGPGSGKPFIPRPIDDEPKPIDQLEIPDEDWKFDEIRQWAVDNGVEVAGLRSKVELLEAVRATSGSTDSGPGA